jgi:hypothetical protein
MEPREYNDATITKILRSIRSVGLIGGITNRGGTIDVEGSSTRGGQVLTPIPYIHIYIHKLNYA